MAHLFFSYSHADEEYRDRLEKHLVMLTRQGIIETWHDRRIPPGAHIDRTIAEQLERADVILLLVSADFLASPYCYDVEMQRALKRDEGGEAVVIPVILRPCDWQGAPFGRLRALPTDGKPVSRWTDLDEAFLEGRREAVKFVDELKRAWRSETMKATQLLKNDHATVKKLFARFRETTDRNSPPQVSPRPRTSTRWSISSSPRWPTGQTSGRIVSDRSAR